MLDFINELVLSTDPNDPNYMVIDYDSIHLTWLDASNPYFWGFLILGSLVFGVLAGKAKGERRKKFMRSSLINQIFVIIIAAGIFIVISQFIGHKNVVSENHLREQFQLPQDVTFTDIGRPKGSMFPIEGTVYFTKKQLTAYQEQIQTPSRWPLFLVNRRALTDNTIYDGMEDRTLWHDLPLPPMTQKVDHLSEIPLLYNYWWDDKPQDRDITNGKFFCAYLTKQPDESPPKVTSCVGVSKKTAKFASPPVRAILDFDTRTMYMRVR